MLVFLSENLATIIICAALIVIVALVIRSIIKDRKNGKSCGGCCGDCSACHGCDMRNEKNLTGH